MKSLARFLGLLTLLAATPALSPTWGSETTAASCTASCIRSVARITCWPWSASACSRPSLAARAVARAVRLSSAMMVAGGIARLRGRARPVRGSRYCRVRDRHRCAGCVLDGKLPTRARHGHRRRSLLSFTATPTAWNFPRAARRWSLPKASCWPTALLHVAGIGLGLAISQRLPADPVSGYEGCWRRDGRRSASRCCPSRPQLFSRQGLGSGNGLLRRRRLHAGAGRYRKTATTA